MYKKKVIKGISVACGFCKIEMFLHPSRIKQNKFGVVYCSQLCKANAMKEGKAGYGLKNLNKDIPYKKCYRYKVKTIKGFRIYMHRWVMEEHLNRKLESHEFVHHINGDTHDNRIENLMLVDNISHGKIEFSSNSRIHS